ncbi:hypothetical protein [uncultured Kocuria sp.]|uniref:hypothetical protein n=1 Tax=uncultured Kocuria sp. TaxID=259305 RepID=UPI002596A970|nr:hypothetical protein [uncultured Kocuria sp.]MCT1367837.1 hypothetical protein [Rothia sp. p3-SID1597]
MEFTKRFFTLLFVPLAAAVFSFATLWLSETDAPLVGRNVLSIASDITSPRADTPTSSPEFLRTLETEANNRHLNIARLSDNAESPASGAELQVLITQSDDPSQHLLTKGYSPFNAGYDVVVKPWDSSQQDPRAFYLLFGDSQAMEGLDDALAAQGYMVRQFDRYSFDEVLGQNIGSPLSFALIASLVAASCFSCAMTLVSAKKVARLRLAGWSVGRILGHDFCSGAVPYLAGLLVTTGITALFLSFYNGLASFGIYLAVFGSFATVFVAAVIVSRFLALGLLYLVPVPATLTGKRPVKSLYGLLCLLKLTCVTLLLVSLGAWYGQFGLATSHLRAFEQWKETPEAAFLPVNGPTWSQAEDQFITDWLVSELRHGNVIISHSQVRQHVPNDDAVIESSYPAVYVNPEYLRHHRIHGVSDHVALEEMERSKTALAFKPDGAPAENLTVDDLIPGMELPALKVVDTDTTGDVFTHGDLTHEKKEFVENPLVVVLPDHVLIENPRAISAWVTDGGLLVRDAEAASNRLRESTAERYVNPPTPGSTYQAHALKLTIADLQATGSAIVVYALLVVFSCLAFAATYAAARKDQLFRRHLFGWNPMLAAGPAFAGIGAVWLSFPAVIGHLIHQAQDPMALISQSSLEVTGYIRFLFVAGLCVGAVVLLLAGTGILVFSRRAVLEKGRIH